MPNLFQNYNLRHHNTFGLEVRASEYVVVYSENELAGFLKNRDKKRALLILGGGSNLLFTSDFSGVVLKPDLKRFGIVNETAEHVFVEAEAGVEWDQFVGWTVENGWGGLENLSLIPGTVGASPIQNIGAYGVEVKDTIVKVEGFYMDDLTPFSFSNADCKFDYRFSIFKSELKNKCIVNKVMFRLSKNPTFILNYGNLEDEVAKMGEVNIQVIRNAVINIRNSKLPDHKIIGNAGSFFKNPIIDKAKAQSLKQLYKDIPLFEAGGELKKTSAAFLIDKAGWKGFRRGDAGVHHKQPLVLVNYGNATGKEIAYLAQEIQSDIFMKYGIHLEMEVNFV